jgi:hypothetical protein
MFVNLSLQNSANIKFKTARAYECKRIFSAETGQAAAFDEDHGQWLVAGHGALIRLQ